MKLNPLELSFRGQETSVLYCLIPMANVVFVLECSNCGKHHVVFIMNFLGLDLLSLSLNIYTYILYCTSYHLQHLTA